MASLVMFLKWWKNTVNSFEFIIEKNKKNWTNFDYLLRFDDTLEIHNQSKREEKKILSRVPQSSWI